MLSGRAVGDVQNAELFTLTYGAIVRQLLTDLEEVEEVNKQLDQMYAPPSSPSPVHAFLTSSASQFIKFSIQL
jgi:hypothetical protein